MGQTSERKRLRSLAISLHGEIVDHSNRQLGMQDISVGIADDSDCKLVVYLHRKKSDEKLVPLVYCGEKVRTHWLGKLRLS